MRTNSFRTAALVSFSLSLFLGGAGCSAPEVVDPEPLVEAAAEPEPAGFEGVAHGFPAMRTLSGKTTADGEFTQWVEGDRLHTTIHYDFGPEHWVEEESVVQQEPTLVQETWSWVESRDGAVQRRFEIDFLSGNAVAEKREENELHRWTEHVDVAPGRSFAGATWALAIRSVRARLLRGEKLQFQTVGFTPKPREATVEVSFDGLDEVPVAGRHLAGDRFRIHPQIPWIAKLFVDVPDSKIWLAHRPPAAFLRFEGPLAEPEDALVRVDLLPGEPSEAAVPASR